MKISLESTIVILVGTTVIVSGNLLCGENERFSICGNNECRPTCKLPQGPPSCDPKCRPGCICLKGLVRRERDKTCVKIEECFKSPSSRNFLQRRPGCPPKKKRIPPKYPHISQGRGPQCKRRFLRKGQGDGQEKPHLPDDALGGKFSGNRLKKINPSALKEIKIVLQFSSSGNNKKTKLEKKLRKAYEKTLNKIKDAIEKNEGLKDDLVKKLKEIRDKMKKNNIKIKKKAKDLLEEIKKKAKDPDKEILDKIYGDDNKEGTTSSSL